MDATVSIDEALAWVGRESEEYRSPVPVEWGAVRHYCALTRDPDLVYWDLDAARASHWGGPVAPPGSLLVWVMPPQWLPDGALPEPPRLHRKVPLPGNSVFAGKVEDTYVGPIRVGDTLGYTECIESITPKTTRVGTGHFIVVRWRFRNQEGEHVADSRLHVFRFAPAERVEAAEQSGGAGPRPAADAERGEPIGEFELPLTREIMALDVSATRDFNPIHFDVDFARARGFRDVIFNTPGYQGLFCRLVGEWVRGRARVRRLSCRMFAPNVPGDTMRVSGRLVEDRRNGGRRVSEVDMRIENARAGVTTRASAEVEWFDAA